MGYPQNNSISLDHVQPDTWDRQQEPTPLAEQYVFIWLVLLLTFGLQFYLLLFCLLKCWSYDRQLTQALKILPSTEKLSTTGPSFIIQLSDDLKNEKPPAYSRYDVEMVKLEPSRSYCHNDGEELRCNNSPYTPLAWDLVQR
ncbi:hypothetical protein UPYG_G00347860 [Umbra pygmaea]|uniref:Uncharacterized protein n=1 Tax=Umbra pygmaea TaxID=75934 RepID=A0ABD0VY24_UMBPY